MITETIFDVDGEKVGVRNTTEFHKAEYELAGSLHLVTINGVNRIFFPDQPGAVAFGSEAFARRAAEVIRKSKIK